MDSSLPPVFWNHDPSFSYPETILSKITGIRWYAGRSLGATREGDVIQFSEDLRESWDWITAHYERVGLPHTQSVVWSDDYRTAKEYADDYIVSPFIFTEHFHEIQPNENWLRIVERMNSKNEFIRLCNSFEIPAPRTLCFTSKEEFFDEISYDSLSYPCYLKLDISASGIGVMKCLSWEDFVKNLDYIGNDEAFQIQQEIDAASFLNVQYYIKPGGDISNAIVSRQILDGFEHSGNVHPSRYNPKRITDKLAWEMMRNGMKDFFAFDVAVYKSSDSGPQYYMLECNPRWNGASYVFRVAEKLGVDHWAGKNFATNITDINDLDFGDLEYDSRTKTGIVVLNWGTIALGKLGIVLFGKADVRRQLEKEVNKILN